MITRHFVEVDGRRVHYRRVGKGPPLLLIHQSPRSGLEMTATMLRWADDFTCYAPDTPGFGESDGLPIDGATCEDFADALIRLMDALGLATTAAYGVHSGAIILITAAKRHPHRFTAVAANGYGVWTDAERADFAANYTPPFVPSAYGEHLTWLWNRVLEQTWFFPWYAVDDAHRLSMAHDDPARSHAVVMELLASGRHYAAGYAAVLQANRDVPGPGEASVPTLIAAPDGDPLQSHITRLGELPANWSAQALATNDMVEAACREHLRAYPAPPATAIAEPADIGFVHVVAEGFDGLIHWRGNRASGTLALHAPGGAAELVLVPGSLAIDLPGHGWSDDWHASPSDIGGWAGVVAATLAALDAHPTTICGDGAAAVLARIVAAHGGMTATASGTEPAVADQDRWRKLAIPDRTPDRFGAYLQRAWSAVRAATVFAPWFDARASNARAFTPAEIDPEMLRRKHLALMRGRAAQPLLDACLDAVDTEMRRSNSAA